MCCVVRGTWCLPQRGEEEEGRRIYGGKEKEERAQWSNLEEEEGEVEESSGSTETK